MRALFAAALITTALTTIAAADEATGTLVALDPVKRVMVMADRTVWNLPATIELPGDLAVGDTVRIAYVGGEDGWSKITKVEEVRL